MQSLLNLEGLLQRRMETCDTRTRLVCRSSSLSESTSQPRISRPHDSTNTRMHSDRAEVYPLGCPGSHAEVCFRPAYIRTGMITNPPPCR